MNESINVRAIQTLNDLKNAFTSFSEEAQECLNAIEIGFRQTLDWLNEEVRVRQQEVKHRHDEVESAERALRSCERQQEDDYAYDCSLKIDDLREARQRLRHTQEELKMASIWLSRVQKAIFDFGGHIRQLKSLATDWTEAAKASLVRATGDLQTYLGISSPTGLIESFSGVPLTSVTETVGARKDNMDSLTETPPKWIERGIAMVSVEDLPMPDGISGTRDFQKVPIDEMKAGLKRLQKMLPVIESGVGAKKEYWAKRDRELGLSYLNGYQKIYEAFYGHDAIRVEKSGDKYEIVNGRHRIWLAKKMDISSLPMNVTELTLHSP